MSVTALSSPTSISVIVPTRDTCALTLACVRSLENAPAPSPVEIIVVDDGSQDGTSDAFARHVPHVRLVRHEAPAGFSAAVNAGLRIATGELLLLLNSDTEIDRQGLSALFRAFQENDRLGVLGAQLRYADGAPQWSGGSAPSLLWLFAQASTLPALLSRIPGYRRARPLRSHRNRAVEWVTGAALAMRREVWEAVGPFDERFQLYAQDLDFCIRAGEAGWRVGIAADFSIMHHHGSTIGALEGGDGGRNAALMWRDLLHWARKHRGTAFESRARRAIISGALLRVAARRLATPFVPASRRFAWRADTETVRAAVRSVYAYTSETSGYETSGTSG